MIWNIIFEQLLKKMGRFAHVTGFADDGCALSVGKNSERNRRRCQEAVDAAVKWGKENGLEFAPDKTVVVNFKRNRTQAPTKSECMTRIYHSQRRSSISE